MKLQELETSILDHLGSASWHSAINDHSLVLESESNPCWSLQFCLKERGACVLAWTNFNFYDTGSLNSGPLGIRTPMEVLSDEIITEHGCVSVHGAVYERFLNAILASNERWMNNAEEKIRKDDLALHALQSYTRTPTIEIDELCNRIYSFGKTASNLSAEQYVSSRRNFSDGIKQVMIEDLTKSTRFSIVSPRGFTIERIAREIEFLREKGFCILAKEF